MKIMTIGFDGEVSKPLNRELAKDHLVLHCDEGLEALGLFRWVKPEALVVDLATPGLGGREFLRRVRGAPEGAGIPILALDSGGAWEPSSMEGHEIRLCFLPRGVHPGLVRERLAGLLGLVRKYPEALGHGMDRRGDWD